MRLTISRSLLDEILAIAAADPDHEVCGLLVGRGAEIVEIRPCRNVAANPRDSFEIDPAALLAAHRAARAGAGSILGHYHSHPNGAALPSARDAAAAEPGSRWIIVAGGEARAWHAVRGGAVAGMFEPVEIRTR